MKSESGFALVSTMLLLSLLLSLALPLGMLARLQRKAAAYNARRVQVRALVWSALQMAVTQLPAASAAFSYPVGAGEATDVNGSMGQGGRWISSADLIDESAGGFLVRITDEAGKIPLSWLRADMLAALPGMDEGKAAAVLDWVDADETPRPAGAEAEAYQAAGYQPRNGFPLTVAELAMVDGIAAELLWGEDRNRNGLLDAGEDADGDGMLAEGLADWVTSSPGNRVNLNTAPAAVLAALPGSSAALVDEIIARRTETPFAGSAELRELASFGAENDEMLDWVNVTGGVLHLQITAWPAAGRPMIKAEAYLQRSPAGGAQLLYWRTDG